MSGGVVIQAFDETCINASSVILSTRKLDLILGILKFKIVRAPLFERFLEIVSSLRNWFYGLKIDPQYFSTPREKMLSDFSQEKIPQTYKP
jgi:hypothetical protein